MDEEVKIVYLERRREGAFERAIHGRIVAETDDFITIERDDGKYRISKRVIARIEERKPVARPEEPDESDCDGKFDGESYR